MTRREYVPLSNNLSQGSSTFSGRGPIYILHITFRAAVIADYKICMDILNIIIETGGRVFGIYGSLIWSETPMELIFNPMVNFGEVRRGQLAKSTRLTSTLVLLGSFQIFKGLFKF